ncbi:MAG: carbohydrate ABC transporter permease [Spirochaetales bacterium]|jgi:putative aldouronate transport system permease protein|nr:carbohydrate ABC transporter permease [Spirochaetales bacterium]
MVRRTGTRRGADEWITLVISYATVSLFSVLCGISVLRVVALAFSDESAVMSGAVGLIPIKVSLVAFRFIFASSEFTRSLKFTVLVTAVYVVTSQLMLVIYVYPLSKNYLKGVKFFRLFTLFSMLFNGGILPTYLVVRSLGLLNTMWALIIPTLISPFNAILLMTFFKTISSEYEEAARVEGASHLAILFKIYLPMSKPAFLTILLFGMVGRWNGWFDALMYITRNEYFTLQIVLRNLLALADTSMLRVTVIAPAPLPSIQAAALIFAIFPILLVYPFLQKYFVKGIMLGGIKG